MGVDERGSPKKENSPTQQRQKHHVIDVSVTYECVTWMILVSRAVQESCLPALASIELRAPSQHCYLDLLRAGRWRLLRICFFEKTRAWYSFCGRFNAGRLGGGLIVESDAVL